MAALEITTMAGCPLLCTFCPQDRLKASYGKNNKYLRVDQFKPVLQKIPKHCRIDFSGMSEPWANPWATQMLGHALERGYSVAIYTTLHGMSSIDADRVIELIKAYRRQVEGVCLHLPDASGNMRGWKYSPEYEAVLRKFLDLGTHSKLREFEVMTMDGNGRIHEGLEHLGIRLERFTGISRAGSLNLSAVGTQKIQFPQQHETPVSCASTPVYDHNVMLPNGDVVLCCMDYSLKHVIGNLFTQSYEDLFSSKEMNMIRTENAKSGFSKCTICRSCDNVVQRDSRFFFSLKGARQTARRLRSWVNEK